jgi:hypothetical protein
MEVKESKCIPQVCITLKICFSVLNSAGTVSTLMSSGIKEKLIVVSYFCVS